MTVVPVKRGLDVLAIALWALFVSLLPDDYRTAGAIAGAALLAAFLTLYDRRLAAEEMEASLREAVKGLDVDDTSLCRDGGISQLQKAGCLHQVFRVVGGTVNDASGQQR